MSALKKKKQEDKVKEDKAKDDVIHIRTAPDDKSLIERAAQSQGLSVSAFMLQNSIRAARRELSEIERTSLSVRDAQTFYSAVISPPKPNEALKRAFKDYDKQKK